MTLTFMIFFGRDMPRRMGFVVALLACAEVSLLVLLLLGGNVTNRLDLQGLSDEGRLSAYRSTLRIISDNPWFGTGLGTFVNAFPAYRNNDISISGLWDRAHSTPLELASDMGILLALVVALAWITALIVLTFPLRRSRRAMKLPLSALAVSLIALLHSSIDFSLQIAGYSIVVFALLGLGLSQAVASRDEEGNGSAADKIGLNGLQN
jgi:O-antigen ligase